MNKIKQFKDNSSNFWLNSKHYHLNKNGEIEFVAGGIQTEEEIQFLRDFCKRNNKRFKEREPSIFEQEEKEYNKVMFGKHAGKSTIEIVAEDKRYARWLYDSVTDVNIKSELKELLKIK